MRVMFRTEASPNVGAGHVFRCLALANHFAKEGWDCEFAVNPQAGATVPALKDSPFDLLGPEMAGEFVDLLVVDYYGSTLSYEINCRSWARKIMVIDDLANRRHDCDLLLDQTLGRVSEDYSSLVPDKAKLLLGPSFALLRPEFGLMRSRSLERRKGILERVLVSLGGSDPKDITSLTLRALKAVGIPCEIDVVLGSGSPNYHAVARVIETMDLPVNLHLDTSCMSELMASADLSIGACGTTSWERCALGLPALVIVTAENQRFIAEKLEDSGAVKVLGDWTEVTEDLLKFELYQLASNPRTLSLMSQVASEICDGRGLERTFTEILSI